MHHAPTVAARDRIRRSLVPLLAIVGLLASLALAHQTVRVGDGDEQYDIVVGFTREPAFTDERNGIDLIVRTPEGEGVEGLEQSLNASITAPDGTRTHTFALRPQFGRPGAYSDDVILTEPGVYTIRVWGFVGAIEVDETYHSHEVRPLASLRFP
jgi:hypothetical protein